MEKWLRSNDRCNQTNHTSDDPIGSCSHKFRADVKGKFIMFAWITVVTDKY